MTAVIVGLDAIQEKLKSFMLNVDDAAEKAVNKTAIQVQRGSIKLIRTPSIGTYVTRYTAGGKPYEHVASKEGDAPNTDTGRLIGSIDMSHNSGDLFAYVSTNLQYGFYLETVLNRPWLEPAKEAEKGTFEREMKLALDEQVKKA